MLTRRLGLSPIVGYMVGGLLIGEHALGWIVESPTTHLLAELGVVFLLFDIGLHFLLQHIWDARRDIFGLGPIQIVLCVIAFAGIALLFGFSFEIALLVGGALALSSTAVVQPTLQERRQNNCPVGRTATAVLILQDVFQIRYEAIENDYDRFTAASVDGYQVTYGDLHDLRLAQTMSMNERSSIVIADARLNVSQQLMPIVRERFPNLTRFVSIEDPAQAAAFESIGMTPVVHQGGIVGLSLAQAVLESQGVDEGKIDDWLTRRRQESELEVISIS